MQVIMGPTGEQRVRVEGAWVCLVPAEARIGGFRVKDVATSGSEVPAAEVNLSQ